MRRENWVVGDYGIRPITADKNICTYCRQPRREEHKPGCVIRKRTVVVRLEVEYVKLVPEDFDAAMVDFVANEGTRCIDNSIEELARRIEKFDNPEEDYEGITCFCGHAREVYLREATEWDERVHGVHVIEALS